MLETEARSAQTGSQPEARSRATVRRRLPVGAEPQPGGGVHFRVWAPRSTSLRVVLEGGLGAGVEAILDAEDDGYHAGLVLEAGAGTLYRFGLDRGDALYPDPASRFQPDGPEGPSRVEDSTRFAWTDHGWRGVTLAGQVIYEMHIGTFTPEGTWQAALRELPALASLGVTLLEIMPVSDFAGAFGWGYDVVDFFAPTRLYGAPDDARVFVDRAHALGLGVILDVVYNHLGPRGNVLPAFSDDYVSRTHATDWGEALNFDGPGSGPVREFFLSCVACWIDELHLDGLRIDATQDMRDSSADHILAAMARAARAAARSRSIVLIAENEPQEARLVRAPERGGMGLDAVWNDDFHHSAMVAMTGRSDAYYRDYRGSAQELVSAVKWGFLYQGQRYEWQGKRRGTPACDIEPARFVTYLQNHDQVANSGRGLRVHALTSPGRYRAMTALLLLSPGTPLLFQGQEFAASTPFVYFADHPGQLGEVVCAGRAEFLAQFRALATAEMQAMLPDPCDPDTFRACRLDHGERERHAAAYALTRDLLHLRRSDPVFCAQRPRGVDGAVLAAEALVLRFFGDEASGDRLLVVNLGADLHMSPAPEPLLGPPPGGAWSILWSSEDPRYGGHGTPPLDTDDEGWRMPGHAAVALAPAAHTGEAGRNA